MWETGDGGLEQNGTFDMMGNVWDWNESAVDRSANNMAANRVFRGGSAFNIESDLRSSTRYSSSPTNDSSSFGLRVAEIPEPSSIMLMGVAGGFALFMRRRFRR